jgi:hypothetical protein
MVIRVASNTTAASARTVRLRASVSYVDASATAIAVTPVADVAYILLNSAALLDTTGRYRFVPQVVVVSDLVALTVSKQFADAASAATTQDDLAWHVTKALQDSVSFTEVFVATLVFIRTFADSAAVADTKTLAVDKTLVDLVALGDAAVRNFTKSLADGVAMNDAFDLTDGATYTFTKGVNNVVSVLDTKIVSTNKGVSDMIGASDAGSLVSQGYCDFSYFAEDYVGAIRTFS